MYILASNNGPRGGASHPSTVNCEISFGSETTGTFRGPDSLAPDQVSVMFLSPEMPVVLLVGSCSRVIYSELPVQIIPPLLSNTDVVVFDRGPLSHR